VNQFREGDLVRVVNSWYDLSCQAGDVGVVLGTHIVPRTLGEGHWEHDDTFVIMLVGDRKVSVIDEALELLDEKPSSR